MALKIIIALVAFIGLTSEVKASHMAGGQITYDCIGTDSFEVTVKVFRYCAGIAFAPTAINVTATSSCGGSVTVQLQRTTGPVHSGFDISQVCSSQSSNCQSGSATGYVELIFTGIFVLNPRCDCWTIGYTPPCCRNGTVNTSGGNVYFEAKLCNNTDTCNNSPTFSTSAIPYVCAGFPVSYNMGATDPDGDSLTYEFICARSAATTNLTYTSPYSCQNAINGITLDTLTGQIQFTATVTGAYIVVVQINEWDTGGNLIGTTMRDIQFRVETCNNTPPVDTLGIQNYQGVGYFDPQQNLVEVCLGDTFSFQVTVWDHVVYQEDSLDTLIVTSNVTQVLPGASFTINPINDSVHTITIGWRAVSTGSLTNSFFIQTSDDACPVPGFTTSSYRVKVIPSTEAGPPKHICRGDTAAVHVIGGSSVTWRTLSGDSIVWGTNFECDTTPGDTCMAARFWPDSTSVYEVSSNLGQGCKTIDTLKVVVAADYQLSISNDTLICFTDSTIPITVSSNLAASYTYNWSPGAKIDDATLQTPNVTPILDTRFNVTVTSDSGCIKDTFMNVYVTPPFPGLIRATAEDTVVCAGNPLRLEATLGHSPNTCGLSSYACSGGSVSVTIGTGTTANGSSGSGPTVYPSPYGSAYNSAKHQFLIRRSELAGQGVDNGMITSLGFQVANVGGISSYTDFTIKLKCTSDTALSSWHTGLAQVFNPKTVTVAAGWNDHIFDVNYDYDGVSNLIVEVCFSNNSAVSNSTTYFTPTTFNSCLSNYINAGSACSSTQSSWGSLVNRPNMHLGYCAGPDSAGYTYKWIPSTYLNHDTLYDPTATVYDSITYQVVVTDTFGKCFDTSQSVTIKLTTVEVNLPDTSVCPGVGLQLQASGRSLCPGGGNYQWSPANLFNNDTIPNPIITAYTDVKVTVDFSDTCGCSTQDTLWVRMASFDPPNIISQDPNCGFDNGSYNITGSGGVAPYIYSIDSGQTYQTTGNFNNLANGYYNILIKDSAGCYSGKLDTLTNNAPLIDSILTADLLCFESQDGEISVFASGGLPPYQYSADSGQTFQTSLRLQNLSAGDHYVIVQASDGCFTTPRAINLTEPPLLTSGLGKTEVTCFGDCDAITIASPTGGTPPYTIQWGNGGTQDTARNVCGGLDSLVIVDDHNCKFDSVFTVVEYPEVTIDSVVTGDITCFGFGDGTIDIAASGGKSSIYYSIDGGVSYSSFYKFNNLNAGNYTVKIRDINNCQKDQPIVITEPPRMELFTNLDTTTICIASCTTLTASATGGNAGGYTFYWGPGLPTGTSTTVCPEENSTYTIYAEDSKGCVTNVKNLRVNLYDSLRAVVSDDLTLCAGERTTLVAIPSGGRGAGYRYNWSPISGLTAENSPTPTALPHYSTMYYFTLSDDCGTPPYIDSVYIEVLPLPVVEFASDTDKVCDPGTVEFINSTSNGLDCRWDFGNGLKLSTCEKVAAKFTQPGWYDVQLIVTDANGCTDSLTKEDFIQVMPSPIANFSTLPEKATVIDPTYQFYDQSSGEIIRWLWNFESLGKSEVQDPIFVFPDRDTGSYPVRLEVEAANGCVDDTVMVAVIGAKFTIYVPAAFTPNEDGINEIFLPQGLAIEDDQFEMHVYDRWGKLLFQSQDKTVGWDGKVNGVEAEVGTYSWRLFIGDYESEKGSHEFMGTVNLIR